MLSILLGIFTIGLGIKGFTAKGLPWSRTKNITGTPAKIIGVICILLGSYLILEGTWVTWRMLNGGFR